MQVLSVFFAISLFLGMLFMQNQHMLEANAKTGEAAAISGNMRIYRNAVVNYAHVNVGITGSIADSSLELLIWFKHMPAVKNYVAGGKGYVYFSLVQPELAYRVLKSSSNSILAGIKYNGILYNPLSGIMSIRLPEVIPEGSVVYAEG